MKKFRREQADDVDTSEYITQYSVASSCRSLIRSSPIYPDTPHPDHPLPTISTQMGQLIFRFDRDEVIGLGIYKSSFSQGERGHCPGSKSCLLGKGPGMRMPA